MSESTNTLQQLARKVRLTSEYGKASLPYEKRDEWQQKAHDYRCTLRYQGRQYAFDYFMGPGCTDEPDTEGTLDCLLSDSQAGEQSFEEFCSEFGYDEDSRKAERTWVACQKVAKNMRRLFGDDYETFLYSDRN